MTDLEYLKALYEQLGPRERAVTVHFMTRLLNGQKQYGRLTIGKKNWPKELFEELIDSSVYGLAALLDLAEQEEQNDEGTDQDSDYGKDDPDGHS